MWWKTFDDQTEPYLLFRRNSMGGIWTVMWLLAFCCLMGILGPSALPYLALPTALCGLYVFLSYVTGVVGMVVLIPLLAYGWLCIAWFLAYGYPVLGSLIAQLEGLLVIAFVVPWLIAAPHVRAKLLIPVVAEGFFYACICWGCFWLIAPEPEHLANYAGLDALLHRMVDFYFVGLNVTAAIVLAIVAYVFVHDLPSHPTVRRQLALDGLLFGAGTLLTLAAALLCRLHPALGALLLLAGYVVIALWCQGQHVEQPAWVLVPLVLLATLAVVAVAPADYLPAYGPATALVRAIQNGPAGACAQVAVLPLVEGLSTLLGGLAAHLVQAGMSFLAWVGSYAKVVIEPAALALAGLQAQYGGPAAYEGTKWADASAEGVHTQLDDAADALAWQMTELPQDSLLAAMLCLFLCVFVLCVVMGTIRGIFDIKALDAVDDTARDDMTLALPAWLIFDPLRRGGQDQGDAALDAEPGAESGVPEGAGVAAASAMAPAAVGSTVAKPEDTKRVRLLKVLGLPTAKKEGRRRFRLPWDEQLSGQILFWEGAKLSKTDQLRRQKRHERKVGPGLWWKVFEDDGRFALIPKGDLFGTIMMLAPALLLLRFTEAAMYGQMVMPLALILLALGIGYVLGLEGVIAGGPLLTFGWTCLIWMLKVSDTSYRPGYQSLIWTVQGFAVIVILSFFTPSLRRSVGWTMSLVFYGIAATWFCARRFAAGYLDEATVRAYLGYAYGASLAVAALFTAWALYKEVRLLRRWKEGRSDEVKSVVLVLAGVVPLLVAKALAGLGGAVALLGATACYAVLAMAARLKSAKGLSCLLLPLMVGAALAFAGRADAGALPPSVATDALLAACASNPLVGLLAGGAQPVVDGFSMLLGGAVTAGLKAMLSLPDEAAAKLPAGLVSVWCMVPGILLIASAMGVGVSVLESLRPQLVAAQLSREEAAMEGESGPTQASSLAEQPAAGAERELDSSEELGPEPVQPPESQRVTVDDSDAVALESADASTDDKGDDATD